MRALRHLRHIFSGLARPFLVVLALGTAPALAQETATEGTPETIIDVAGSHELADFLWTHRPLVIFSDSPSDPRYTDQIEMLRADLGALEERDVMVLTDTDPAAQSPLRSKLRPRGFVIVLVGKDGVVKLRKPTPWTVRELSRAIDKMPMRREEIRVRRDNRS